MAISINAFIDRDSTEVIAFNDDAGQPFDFDTAGASKIEGVAGGRSVECTWSGDKVSVNYGALLLQPGIYMAQIVLFSADYPKGKVIAGPGLPVEIELTLHRSAS
tara:strand:+ start:6269 stop:6583 length:315 start_codon:yes stop_codon:yes gene_type:complete